MFDRKLIFENFCKGKVRISRPAYRVATIVSISGSVGVNQVCGGGDSRAGVHTDLATGTGTRQNADVDRDTKTRDRDTETRDRDTETSVKCDRDTRTSDRDTQTSDRDTQTSVRCTIMYEHVSKCCMTQVVFPHLLLHLPDAHRFVDVDDMARYIIELLLDSSMDQVRCRRHNARPHAMPLRGQDTLPERDGGGGGDGGEGMWYDRDGMTACSEETLPGPFRYEARGVSHCATSRHMAAVSENAIDVTMQQNTR